MTDNPMDAYPWTPTLRLRELRTGEERRLQQQWRNVTSGETEWREIETVEEADADA